MENLVQIRKLLVHMRNLVLAALLPTALATPALMPFDILPANASLPPVHRNSKMVSWGIAVAKGDDGRYHSFIDTIAGGCSLGYWQSNSEIYHATADAPEGPFSMGERVLPTFNSNPSLTRAADGTWLLFSIGQGTVVPTNCTTTHAPGSMGYGTRGYTGNITTVHYSKSLNGPWEQLRVPDGSGKAGATTTAILPGFTNPSATALANGTIVVAGIPQGCCSDGFAHVATAPSWQGPYTIVRDRPLVQWDDQKDRLFVFEDVHLWFDSPSHRWMMLMHQYNRSEPQTQVLDGGFAISADSNLWSPWNYSSWREPAYTNAVEWTDGGDNRWVDLMQRRERPFLLHDAGGAPTHLYTAVCPPGDVANAECYTIVNPLRHKHADT